MPLGATLREAWRALRAQPLRTGFLVVATAVGITFLVAVVALIEGTDRYVRDVFGREIYGINTVVVRRRPSVQVNEDEARRRAFARRPRLREDDAAYLAARLETPAVVATTFHDATEVEGPRGRRVANVWASGVSASYFRVQQMELAEGRFFSEFEAARGATVAVLGRDVARALFPDGGALDGRVRLDGVPYQVVGVLAPRGSLFGLSLDRAIYVPARSPFGRLRRPQGTVDAILVHTSRPEWLPTVRWEVESWMRLRHRLRPQEPNDFELETADDALAFWTRIANVLRLALPALVAISLVVGGVVILNLMLVTVVERTREIGLRKALGATPRAIVQQFLVEAALVGMFGGLTGVALGLGLAALVRAASPLPVAVPLWALLLGVGLSTLVGLASGWVPARRAAALPPVEALRYE